MLAGARPVAAVRAIITDGVKAAIARIKPANSDPM
jgi:hypothetical protein